MNDGDYLRLKYGWEAGQIQIVLPPAGLRDAQVGVFPFTAAGRQIIQGLPDPREEQEEFCGSAWPAVAEGGQETGPHPGYSNLTVPSLALILV